MRGEREKREKKREKRLVVFNLKQLKPETNKINQLAISP
jgi:hypothetical protein